MSHMGPVPKRTDARAGKHAKAESEAVTKDVIGSPQVEPPQGNPEWHHIVRAWYNSLAQSGQSYFYEPSDWVTAIWVAEQMHRELSPKPIVLTRTDGSTYVEWHDAPMLGASMSAILKAMNDMMTTEPARRRAQIELQKGGSAKPEQSGAILSLLDKLGG